MHSRSYACLGRQTLILGGHERARCLPTAGDQPAGVTPLAEKVRRHESEYGQAVAGAPEAELAAEETGSGTGVRHADRPGGGSHRPPTSLGSVILTRGRSRRCLVVWLRSRLRLSLRHTAWTVPQFSHEPWFKNPGRVTGALR